MEVPNTIIIESNKKTATELEYENYKDAEVNTDSMPIDRSSSWKSYIENGIQLDEGDQISIESSQINITGDPNNTMEFTRGQASQGKDPLVDNRCGINIGYYITNKHQNNFPLPLWRHTINLNIDNHAYGSPNMNSWYAFANCVPLMAVEGARYNPDFYPKAGPPAVPNDIPMDIASWYLGESTGPHLWQDNTDDKLLPWLMWIGAAPLQNGPYEIYKPNEVRLYKHKYQKYTDTADDFNGSYYNDNYFDLDATQTDSPYFDLTENIIDFEIEEGFATPSSVGEYMTASLIELDIEKKKKYDESQLKDAPEPTIFRFEGVFQTAEGVPDYISEDFGGIPAPQILERHKVNDKINKTFTTARTPAGTILEDYLEGNFTGAIQFPFLPSPDLPGSGGNPTPLETNRIFFSDMLDGDVRKTAQSIKFQKFKLNMRTTHDILQNDKFQYDNEIVIDGGKEQVGTDENGAPKNFPCFGDQVIIFEDLPRATLIHHTGDTQPKPKFWINISGEREGTLAPNVPPIDTTDQGSAAQPRTIYNSSWKTCPPVVAQGMTALDMRPFDLIPTNIVATRGSIAMMKRVFNTGQYIQDNEDVNNWIKDNITNTLKDDNLLRNKAVNNNNILDKLVVPFQVGATDDSTTTTEAYYSTNQINLINPAMVFYYLNPAYNDPTDPNAQHQGINMLNNGLVNQSYMVLGEYDYTTPQLPNAPNQMPDYAISNDGSSIGTWDTLTGKFLQAQSDGFPTIAEYPRLMGRCWWNKDVLDNTKITPNVRKGFGAILKSDPIENNYVGLDVDSQKKGKECKYNVEIKTTWDERLDPQSPNFKCKLHGHDGTEATSHFQFKNSNTDEYFDVKLLQGNVLQSTFQDMTDDSLLSIQKNGVGIVVAYLKPAAIDPNSDLFLGYGFLEDEVVDGKSVLDIPYICVVNMSYLTAGNDETKNLDLLNRNKVQIPTPCIGEIFGSSLSCQDNTWSKIVNTQKVPRNMRCVPVPDPVPANSEGKLTDGTIVSPNVSNIPEEQALSIFQTNENIPPPDVDTYPSYSKQPNVVVNKQLLTGADFNSGFYRMCDYVPYVKIGCDNPLITFDDNYSRFSISNFHTPFYNGNRVNPFWVRVDELGWCA